jgi:hypothetical protein
MTTHAHHHPHPHLPLRFFPVEHPYAGDWLLVAAGTLAALLLWYWNS